MSSTLRVISGLLLILISCLLYSPQNCSVSLEKRSWWQDISRGNKETVSKPEEVFESQFQSLVLPKSQPKPKPKLELEVKSLETTVEMLVDNYTPQWNIEGSWRKAEDRQEIIRHLLTSPNHRGRSKASLMSLSTDELQRMHDQDHNDMKFDQKKHFPKWTTRWFGR
jgi:hypothetical protein